jgi:hypothetical protein
VTLLAIGHPGLAIGHPGLALGHPGDLNLLAG